MKWIAIPIVAAALATPAVAAKTVPGFIGATRAVEIAEQAVGGQVLEVELDHRRNRTVYELELVKDDALHEVDIDARSGKVVARRTPVVQGYWKRFKDADEFREAGRARCPCTTTSTPPGRSRLKDSGRMRKQRSVPGGH